MQENENTSLSFIFEQSSSTPRSYQLTRYSRGVASRTTIDPAITPCISVGILGAGRSSGSWRPTNNENIMIRGLEILTCYTDNSILQYHLIFELGWRRRDRELNTDPG
jgi:hypothetical protein